MCNCHHSQPQSKHRMNEAFENVQLHRRLEGAAMIKMCLTSIFVELSIKTQAANVLLRWSESARKFSYPVAFHSFFSNSILHLYKLDSFLNFMLNILIRNWFSMSLEHLWNYQFEIVWVKCNQFSIWLVSRIRFNRKFKWSDKKYCS